MRGDKKNRGGQIHFSLPAAIGRMNGADEWTTAVPDQAIERWLTGSNRLK
jgi:hypothetical protein